MGLDSLIDDEEEQQDKEQADETADELGIEDKEELEELDDRLGNTYEIITDLHERVENLEEENSLLRGAVAKLVDEVESMQGDQDTSWIDDLEWGSDGDS